jgi:kumamolisin
MRRSLAWTVAVLLLAASLAPARALALETASLPGSIKPVEAAPLAAPLNPNKPAITRRTLKAEESVAQMRVEVSLKMRNFAQLEARVAHGEKVAPAEIAAKYEPLPGDYAAVVKWLTSQGLTITRPDPHHSDVFARGTVTQIQKAFQVTFARVAFQGKEYTSAITAPNVPAAIAPLLIGVNGLQPHLQMHKHILRQHVVTNDSSGSASYLPKQIATAYGASSLYNSDIVGSGQTIAIVIDTFPATSDLVAFWKDAGVKQSLTNIQFVQAVAGTLPDPEGEETLDTEWSSSMAPGARVRIYAATDLLPADEDAAYSQVYDDVTAHPEYAIHQMSMSYGYGEEYVTDSQAQTDHTYFVKLAAVGVTLFASSGDDGSTPGVDGTGDDTGPLQVESPASDPDITSVGGTSLQLNNNNTISSEIVWNDESEEDGASGGGISMFFSGSTCPWQTGVGVISGTNRQVPDVAASADPQYGAIIVLGDGRRHELEQPYLGRILRAV